MFARKNNHVNPDLPVDSADSVCHTQDAGQSCLATMETNYET